MADELVRDRSQDAAKMRTAISRAYYSIHLLAREILNEVDHHPKRNDNIHFWVYEQLHNCSIQDVEEAAQGINELGGQRRRADYRMADARIEELGTALPTVLQAQEILDQLDRIRKDKHLLEELRKALHESS